MEPRIQYAKTADGVSIAFWTLGEGMPVVHLPLLVSHIQLEWQIAECRRWYERLAEKRKLVRYDFRGGGLSERSVTDFSVDALVLDVEAVVDRLGLEKFALLGLLASGPAAIAYAARHPERVSHLLLWCTYAAASDWSRSPQVQAVRALMDKDWAFYTEAMAASLLGWSAGEPARRYAALVRDSVRPEFLQAVAIPAINKFDVTPFLPHVKVPTLVLHRRQYGLDVDVARGLASRIPDARLALLEGASGAPYLGDTEAVLSAIDEFLGEGQEAAAGAERPAAGAFRTILFTDVEGSTALTQRLGDAKAREVLRQHERIVREALRALGGSEVKTMGDGFMASVPSATRALECAIAMQRAFSVGAGLAPPEGAASSAPTEAIRVRIGLNAGEPIAVEEDLFGTAVILAARIAAQAEGGEILVANVVRELAAGKGFLFADRGETALRGFEDPVRLYEVRWREEA
ncbi:MAG: adenylate/guanylate cyclase domain-containing protein [Chloroflexota bacterium]|nr:adenylate/guanylate cyclase domain-containing protein [Chloroflexota bacterium]